MVYIIYYQVQFPHWQQSRSEPIVSNYLFFGGYSPKELNCKGDTRYESYFVPIPVEKNRALVSAESGVNTQYTSDSSPLSLNDAGCVYSECA